MWPENPELRQVYVDAAMRADIGRCGLAAVVRDPRGAVCQWWGGLAGRLTNNEAEYAAAIFALRRLRNARAQTVVVFSDSLILVHQMQGRAATRSPDLQKKQAELREMMRHFHSVSFQHVPRERNRLADALANEVADGQVLPVEVFRDR